MINFLKLTEMKEIEIGDRKWGKPSKPISYNEVLHYKQIRMPFYLRHY